MPLSYKCYFLLMPEIKLSYFLEQGIQCIETFQQQFVSHQILKLLRLVYLQRASEVYLFDL